MTTKSASGAKNILVIDDNPVVLKAMSTLLTGKGYRVFTAEAGAQTLAILDKVRPDLILLDLDFPIDPSHISGPFRDGFLILDWARLLGRVEGIPVFIVSGLDPSEYMARARAAGILTFFSKPVDHEKLLAAITATFAKAPAAPSPS